MQTMDGISTSTSHVADTRDKSGVKSSIKNSSKKISSLFKLGSSGRSSRAERLRKDIGFSEHTWPIEKLFEYYASSAEGLASAQVLQNREKYGWNRLTPAVVVPWWKKYLSQYANVFMFLLLFGGVLCFIAYGIDQEDTSNLYLGVVLFVVVIASATFGYYTESKAESVMEGFKKLVPKKTKVWRDGVLTVLEADELVPGDVVELMEGDQVPADIRVISGQELRVDNSSLTGESEPQERYPHLAHDAEGKLVTTPLEAQNLLFYTTIITSGHGQGVVILTGDKTVMGQIAGLAQESSGKQHTQFQVEVDTFIKYISVVAIVIGVTFIMIGIFVAGADAVSMIVFAIGIIVGTVPEGLLVTLSVALALSAKHMYAKNVLVKGMPSVENLGSTTVIASDKTGTLTQNRMTVQHAWYNGRTLSVPAARNVPQLQKALEPGTLKGPVYDPEDPSWSKLQMVATLCNNSRFILEKDEASMQTSKEDDGDKDGGGKVAENTNRSLLNIKEEMVKPDFNILGLDCTGDASESALIKCMQLLRDVNDYATANPKLFEIKFNSTNKWQLSIHRPEDVSVTAPLLVMKGAPERVIKKCSHILIDGAAVPLTEEWVSRYNEAYESLGSIGERVLGFAYRHLEGFSFDHEFTNQPEPNFPVQDLVFVGLLSLIDPPREGVPEAVAKCHRARIKVYMVTGDHPVTAAAIAKQVGIIDQDMWDSGRALVVTGDDIRHWMELKNPLDQEAKWDWALDHEQLVFARVSPAHKLLIVENCQRRGENVAVTGDGVNDAPALKKANTGIAMGISGKDVSKEAADMILMDDNFTSIVNGIEEGRVIFDNLKKSIAYTLASKLQEQVPFIIFVAADFPLAISTLLILTIDIGCDMLPATALAYEKKEADIMDRPPRNPATDRLVSKRLISFAYLQIGVLQTAAGFLAFLTVLNDYGYNWNNLVGRGIPWATTQLICSPYFGSGGSIQATNCGFGCGEPATWVNESTLTLYGQAPSASKFCQYGCPIPFNGTADPFVEFSEFGFRGYAPAQLGGEDAAINALCGRTCSWYASLATELKRQLIDANNAFRTRLAAGMINPNDPFSYGGDAAIALLLSQAEAQLFDSYCGTANASLYGFPDRGLAYKEKIAPEGGYYWWNGMVQYFPNVENQDNVLRTAQTAYFTAAVVAQLANLIGCKTRKVSVFTQGMRNMILNASLLLIIAIVLLITYVPPFRVVWGTRPLFVPYLFIGLPYTLLVFVYDETRKLIMRTYPKGWVYRNTYW